jgi:hypothetical protein
MKRFRSAYETGVGWFTFDDTTLERCVTFGGAIHDDHARTQAEECATRLNVYTELMSHATTGEPA